MIISRAMKGKEITAQKMKFSIKHIFSKCNQTGRKLRIWLHFLDKSLVENFILCAVHTFSRDVSRSHWNIYYETFLRLKAINYFWKKKLSVDVRVGSKYDSALGTIQLVRSM